MALLLRITVEDTLAAQIEKAPTVPWSITNWRLEVVTDDGKKLEFVNTSEESPPE